MKHDVLKKLILSISMLVSGREEMKKSLESLHYFRDAFPCELILVDTGCSEEQRALAEQYADKIVNFEWCNDFAAARNAGLREAQGEWFLYLDDDEWFDNPTEIVAFFTSGEYQKYDCAVYVVRNYRDKDGVMYDDTFAGRMIRLREGIRFSGRIHEYLELFGGEKKVFSDYVHHYGYAFQDEMEKKRHSERNIGPLLEMVREEPEKMRWVVQLAQEYAGIGEHEKAVEACRRGLEEHERQLRERKGDALVEPLYQGGVYSFLIASLSCLERYEEALEWIEKALAEKELAEDVMAPTVAHFHMFGARNCTRLQRHGESCQHFRTYLKYKKKLGGDNAAIERGSCGCASGAFGEQMLYGTVLLCMESLIRMEEEKLSKQAFYLLDWSDRRLLGQGEWEQKMLDACCSVPYRPLWAEIMQTLVSRADGDGMKEMQTVFLTLEIEYKKNGETEKLGRLRKIVSELKVDHHYILYTKILWAGKAAKEGLIDAKVKMQIEGLFAELFERHPGKLTEIRSEGWEVAEKLGIQVEPLLLKVPYRTWKDELEEWNKDAAEETLRQWEKRVAAWKTAPDIRYDIFDVRCAEGLLLRYWEKCRESKENQECKGNIGITQWEETLLKYADSVLALYGSLYREDVLKEIPETLPDELWIALYLKKLKTCRENGDDKGALAALRKCLGVSPILEKPLEAYAEILKKEIQDRDAEAKQARRELEGLVKALKATAKQRIERGEYAAAREILLQIQACVPDDGEVKALIRKAAGG